MGVCKSASQGYAREILEVGVPYPYSSPQSDHRQWLSGLLEKIGESHGPPEFVSATSRTTCLWA